jgi:asparagine synthase (glutamine-hydrolysing)
VSIQLGAWNFDGKPIKPELITRMTAITRECRSDEEALHVEINIAMSYRPFHTTTESRREHQPHRFARDQVITWDGRLDNREELRSQLTGIPDDDSTDISIVAAGFQRWGVSAFDKLIGDWALAIWDSREQTLIIARDYLGVRHLYFNLDSNGITWSTNLGSLLREESPFTLSHEYVASYFTQWPDTALTPYSEIRAVPPGSFVVVRRGCCETHKYWHFRPRVTIRYKNDREYEDQFRMFFRLAVRSRLRSESSVLAHLSGGLDSSSIVCMADDILTREATGNIRVDTFSFYDPDEPGEEDYRYWSIIEELRGYGHHAQLQALGDTFSLERSASAVTPGFGIREELKAAESHVIKNGNYRVILSGAGGDQMLGQTIDPAALIADSILHLQLGHVGRELIAWSLRTRHPFVQILARSLLLLLPTTLRARMISSTGVQPWLNPHFMRKYKIIDRLLPASEGPWHWLPGNRAFYQLIKECAGFVAAIPPADEEVRYPFLDRRLVEFLASIPRDQLTRSGERRSLMRRALADIVPGKILSRQTKSTTGHCDVLTLRKHWGKVQGALNSLVTARAGYLDAEGFGAALTRFAQGCIPPYNGQLLRGLALEFWLRDKLAKGIVSNSPA